MNNAIDVALADVVSEDFVLTPDGQRLPQSSSPKIIEAALRLLEVSPGDRVLEVGTGSGYSTALLAHLVGPSGMVISLDIDPKLVERASHLLTEHNLAQVKVISADGRKGYYPEAPFERIIVWATTDLIPQNWIKQLCPSGLIVAPVRLLSLADTNAIVRIRADMNKTLIGERVIPGSFVSLTSEPLNRWYGPSEEADIKTEESEPPVLWASAEWLRQKKETREAEQILQLMQIASLQQTPLHSDENVEALRAYLLATYPEGLTTAFTQSLGPAIGYSQPSGLALLSLCNSGYAAVGEQEAAAKLSSWIANWRAAGRPSFEQLRPTFEFCQHSYKVGVTLVKHSALDAMSTVNEH